MKKIYISIILISLVLSSCISQNNSKLSFSNEELALVQFMDSIGKLNPEIWEEKVSHNSDSVYESQIQMDVLISDLDFEKLKVQSEASRMDLNLFKRIFPDEIIDSMYLESDSLPIFFFPFTRNKFDFFAIQIFKVGWDAEVYFFNKNKIVAKHHISHRYGLEIASFQDENGETVVYYEQNFGSGTGIFWNNFNFFKYSNNSLIPVLNEVSDVHEINYFESKSFQFLTEIVSINPLVFKMSYEQYFMDSIGKPITIIKDSEKVVYNWNDSSKQFVPDFSNSKLSKYKILSYYLDDTELLLTELMFINTHYDLLVRIINGKNKIKRKLVFDYLNEVKIYTKM